MIEKSAFHLYAGTHNFGNGYNTDD